MGPQGPLPARVANDDAMPPCGSGAGGGFSTAGDLALFASALMRYRLLDSAHTAMATTGYVSMGRGSTRYGFGFGVDSALGITNVGHSGGAPGVNTFVRMYPLDGVTVVILANGDPPMADGLRFLVDSMYARMRGEKAQ